jgi:hypothetical protein
MLTRLSDGRGQKCPWSQGALLHRCRSQHGRQEWIDKPAQHAAGLRQRLCVTAKAAHGLITRDVNGAGARSAVNPHAACDVAGTGNEITATPTRARRGKPWRRPRSCLRITASSRPYQCPGRTDRQFSAICVYATCHQKLGRMVSSISPETVLGNATAGRQVTMIADVLAMPAEFKLN